MRPGGRVSRLLTSALLLTALQAGPAPALFEPASDNPGARVWTALEDDGRIGLVSVSTGVVLRREITPGGPHNITVARDGTVVVALWRTDRIAILRPGAADPMFVSLGGAPHDVKVTGNMIVVANQGSTRIDRVRLWGKRLPSIWLKAHPHDLAISPDGRKAWVTLEGSDDIAVVNLFDPSVHYVSTGVRPHDLLFAPGGRLWVTDWNGAVHVFRGSERVRTLDYGREMHHLAFTPDGDEVWVTDHGARRIFVIGTYPIALHETIEFPGEPHHVAITANGRWAVVADHANARLIVYDVDTRRLTRRIAVGDGPHGVWAVPG